jgi:hypothetical protein
MAWHKKSLRLSNGEKKVPIPIFMKNTNRSCDYKKLKTCFTCNLKSRPPYICWAHSISWKGARPNITIHNFHICKKINNNVGRQQLVSLKKKKKIFLNLRKLFFKILHPGGDTELAGIAWNGCSKSTVASSSVLSWSKKVKASTSKRKEIFNTRKMTFLGVQ